MGRRRSSLVMNPDLSIFLETSISLFVDLSIYRDEDIWNLSIRNLFYVQVRELENLESVKEILLSVLISFVLFELQSCLKFK